VYRWPSSSLAQSQCSLSSRRLFNIRYCASRRWAKRTFLDFASAQQLLLTAVKSRGNQGFDSYPTRGAHNAPQTPWAREGYSSHTLLIGASTADCPCPITETSVHRLCLSSLKTAGMGKAGPRDSWTTQKRINEKEWRGKFDVKRATVILLVN
jgi:hypothetical protein